MWPKSSKTLVKNKTPVKLQAWNFTSKTKSSYRRCSFKKGVLKKFAKFTGKHLYWSLFFHNVTSQKLATLLKERLHYRCFPVHFAKFLRTPFSENTFGRLFLQNLFVRVIRNKWLLLNSNIAPLMFDLCLWFKKMKMFK